jgi:hypothetical protein
MDQPSACESCGCEGEQLWQVQRLYVTPAAWDTEGSVEHGELEWWCSVCRTHYPHADAEADDDAAT